MFNNDYNSSSNYRGGFFISLDDEREKRTIVSALIYFIWAMGRCMGRRGATNFESVSQLNRSLWLFRLTIRRRLVETEQGRACVGGRGGLGRANFKKKKPPFVFNLKKLFCRLCIVCVCSEFVPLCFDTHPSCCVSSGGGGGGRLFNNLNVALSLSRPLRSAVAASQSISLSTDLIINQRKMLFSYHQSQLRNIHQRREGGHQVSEKINSTWGTKYPQPSALFAKLMREKASLTVVK